MTYFLCSYFDFTPAIFYENRVSLISLKSPICKNTACIDRSGFYLFVKFLYFIVSHIDFGQLPVVRKKSACQWRPLSPTRSSSEKKQLLNIFLHWVYYRYKLLPRRFFISNNNWKTLFLAWVYRSYIICIP